MRILETGNGAVNFLIIKGLEHDSARIESC
jgi:hypothetical protein